MSKTAPILQVGQYNSAFEQLQKALIELYAKLDALIKRAIKKR